MYGLAKRNHKIAILDADKPMPMIKHFPITTLERHLKQYQWVDAYEERANAYAERLAHLPTTSNVRVIGSLQSWKYFEHEYFGGAGPTCPWRYYNNFPFCST
ncbi:unnamed protein product [Sphagnum balticum]